MANTASLNQQVIEVFIWFRGDIERFSPGNHIVEVVAFLFILVYLTAISVSVLHSINVRLMNVRMDLWRSDNGW
jgi:hypothetical protein